MEYLFVTEGMTNPSITAIDRTLLKANGNVWHKSSMEKGIVPRSDIDTGARWSYSHTKGWIFGYKLQLTCTTAIDELVVPLTADITTTNVQRTRCMFLRHFFGILFIICIVYGSLSGYDDKKPYGYSKKMLRTDLVCSVESTYYSQKKLYLCSYQSTLG